NAPLRDQHGVHAWKTSSKSKKAGIRKRHCNTGEPCALKGASTVRGGAVGNVPLGNALAAYSTQETSLCYLLLDRMPISRNEGSLLLRRPTMFLSHESSNSIDNSKATLTVLKSNRGATRQHICGSHCHFRATSIENLST